MSYARGGGGSGAAGRREATLTSSRTRVLVVLGATGISTGVRRPIPVSIDDRIPVSPSFDGPIEQRVAGARR